MKKTGIWIDKAKAHLVTLTEGKEYFKTVESEVEFYQVKGGSRSKTPWGPHQTVKDSTYLEREKHQIKAYFSELSQLLEKTDKVYLFGPGETKHKLHKFLMDNAPLVAQKVEAVETTDRMTENQLVAWVKRHFGWERP